MRTTLLIGFLAAFVAAGCGRDPDTSAKRGTDSPRPKPGPGGPGADPHGFGAGPGGGEDFKDAGPVVKLEGVAFTAPDDWTRKKPQSTFIQAEYQLPRAAGDSQDGRLTLSVAGGSIEANIDRWKDQFGGKPAKAHQEKMKADGLAITYVDFSGDFNDQRGPFAPAVKRADYRMIAGIVEARESLVFVKAVGPQKTMEGHADKIKKFLAAAKAER